MTVSVPFEILDMVSGEEVSLRINAFEEGRAMIKPDRAPQGIEVEVLRVHLALGTKIIGVPYYDITSKTLRAQLLPYLRAGGFLDKVFLIHKYGTEPSARFSLGVRDWKPDEVIHSEIKRMTAPR